MPGSWTRVAARASAKKRSTIFFCEDISGSSTLIATWLPRSWCSASQTSPMPPAPIRETTR
jgi:hypothetical protein